METARDVAQQLIETQVGTTGEHKFHKLTRDSEEYRALPATAQRRGLRYLVEVYVDDFVALAMAVSKAQLDHVAGGVMHGIHDVFPSNEDDNEDAISLKKLRKHEGTWMLRKEILGFEFYGEEKTLWLEEGKRNVLLTVLKGWIRASAVTNAGVPFEDFRSVIAKIRHAFIAIPNGKGLLSPCNRVMRKEPKVVYFHRNEPLRRAIVDIRTLLRESVASPTKCSELVPAWPHFVGVKDASGHGVGGIIVGELRACVPTVFRVEWPDDIKSNIKTAGNPTGKITNSDLELAGALLLWLVMEEVCNLTLACHIALFSDNQNTVSWIGKLVAKSSLVAG